MGCYDNISFNCTECGKEMSAQSKGGDCSFRTFDHKAVPLDVAMDCNRHSPYECECGAIFEFQDVSEMRLYLYLKRTN